MEEKSLRDIQEDIIVKLEELNFILDGLIWEKQDEEELSRTLRN